ncbi:MAG TPA: YbhB/YbcL family Raf kinase inhibitor-like protein [Rhizomicrobium sp.]
MRNLRTLAMSALIPVALTVAALAQTAVPPPAPPPVPMSLTSTSFADGGIVPDKYTWSVTTPVSPALAWYNAPAGTMSFALILHDPDVTRMHNSEDYLHWMVFNIPASAHGFAENLPKDATLPDGSIQGKASNGKPGYLGLGAHGNVYHHYVFELYALDSKLALGPDATRADLLKAMDGHILAKAADEGRFHR